MFHVKNVRFLAFVISAVVSTPPLCPYLKLDVQPRARILAMSRSDTCCSTSRRSGKTPRVPLWTRPRRFP